MLNKSEIYGRGSPEADLNAGELAAIVKESLQNVAVSSRVLAIIPDKTRDDNTDLLFPAAARILAEKGVSKFDALVAQGTHAPMSEAEKFAKIGVSSRVEILNLGNIFDHEWNCPQALTRIGELGAEKVREISGGLIRYAVPLTINKLLAPGNYDLILVFGGVVPHEVAGFAGGAKYFFPGVSGAELTHATHWLGALAGIENVIGRIETPTRRLIENAADFIEPEIINFASVVTRNENNRLRTHALFAGDFRASFRKAAEISRIVHIKYTGRKFERVVALLDEHYEELWVGGKASYKLGSVIEEDGELIIYAPHLRCVSDTHGALIERFGYAPLEKIKALLVESGELQMNLCVAAHLAHVAFAGKNADKFSSRFQITLASQIDAETCRRLNLNYSDYRNFRREIYDNDSDTLVVEHAGRDLYLVEP
ncbi:MAG: lactate racemase domain-containing protein [Pyrinomonadaceae bacterium]